VLYGVGLTDADLRKPQVGVSSVWYEGNTCNMHLLRLAEAVRDGVREAGMVGFRFNTVGVSDAISMGTRGMCYSLQSRDLIADSIETVMGAQHYDANISIPGCDKNVSSFSAISAVCRCGGLGVLKCVRTPVSSVGLWEWCQRLPLS
jgi:dihydroxy-acid dehydratase